MSGKWLFLLTDKGTDGAAWWLKIESAAQLLEYLALSDGRYGRAYENWLRDSDFHPDQTGHGPHPGEAQLAALAHYYSLNRDLDVVSGIMNLKAETDGAMLRAIGCSGCVFVNCNGGWNTGRNGMPYGRYEGDFARLDKPAWPSFGEADIRLSKFPGGEHWYARIGPIEVRNGDGGLRFQSREEARATAKEYLQAIRTT